MKLNDEEFELMVNAAWSAFENVLFLWGFTKEDQLVFEDMMHNIGAYGQVINALEGCLELEDK